MTAPAHRPAGRRQRIEAAIERLIDVLDRADGDLDLEPDDAPEDDDPPEDNGDQEGVAAG